MRDPLYGALQTLADFDALDFKAPFYRSLLVGDVSDAVAELSFVECCGVLSAFYGASGYYPQIQGGDIYTYLKETDDYLTPLGLLVLSCDLRSPSFTVSG